MTKHYQSTLSLILWFRSRSHSGAFIGSESQITKYLNISKPTFRKYWSVAESLGLVEHYHTKSKEVWRTKKLSIAFQVLLPFDRISDKFVIFGKNNLRSQYNSFNHVKQIVRKVVVFNSLMIQNFKAGCTEKQQEFFIQTDARSTGKMPPKDKAKLSRIIKRKSREEIEESLRHVVTGSNHLIKYTGLSRTSNHKILKQLSKEGLIQLKTIIEKVAAIPSHRIGLSSFSDVGVWKKRQKGVILHNCPLFVSKRDNCLCRTIGSEVKILVDWGGIGA